MKNVIKKILILSLTVIFVAIGAQLAYSYSDKATKKAEEIKGLSAQKVEMPATLDGIKNITPEELKKWMDEGKAIVILDNRPANEYEAEHIPTARRVGVDELLKNGIKEAEAAGVKKEDTIVNY